MNARDYFELARKLAQMRTEAANRSAVSRGYYAAFHFGKKLIEGFGFSLPKDAAAHDKLYELLNNAEIDSAHDAAALRTAVGRGYYAAFNCAVQFSV